MTHEKQQYVDASVKPLSYKMPTYTLSLTVTLHLTICNHKHFTRILI